MPPPRCERDVCETSARRAHARVRRAQASRCCPSSRGEYADDEEEEGGELTGWVQSARNRLSNYSISMTSPKASITSSPLPSLTIGSPLPSLLRAEAKRGVWLGSRVAVLLWQGHTHG